MYYVSRHRSDQRDITWERGIFLTIQKIFKSLWQIMNAVITSLLGLWVILEVFVYRWPILSKEKENLQ